LLVELCFGTLLFLICFFWGFTALNGVVFQVVTSNQQNIKKNIILAAAVSELDSKGVKHEPIRTDEYTGKQFVFFSDPDDRFRADDGAGCGNGVKY